MVEFGLKLEDNKVDEWSSQYIDYEKLKAVLKRAKASAEYRDGLLKRMPPGVVVEVVQERRDRSSSMALDDNPVSKGDLPPIPTSKGKGKGMVKLNKDYKPLSMGHHPLEVSDKQMSFSSLPEATDATPLLGEPIKEVNSWSNLHHTVFKVTSYLGLADDRPLLLQAYGDADDKLNLFKETYEQEVSV